MEVNAPGDWLARTRILLGDAGVNRLARTKVYVFGLGAVGSYAVEGMARAGIGAFRLIDFDVVHAANLNRQLFALTSTLGRPKAEVAAARVRDINPAAAVEPVSAFAHADNLPELLSGSPSLVLDAVDSLNPKVEIIAAAAAMGIPVYSALGAATRLDADRIRFGPLFESDGCPMGRLVRKRLRKRGLEGGDLWCVYSDEPRNKGAIAKPDAAAAPDEYHRGRDRDTLGSISTLTGMFGLRLAHETILRLVRGPAPE